MTPRNDGGLADILQRALAIDESEIARRKAWLEFEPADARRIAELEPVTQAYAREVIDEFYAHLLRFEETLPFFQDARVLDHVKRMQEQYLRRLTAGEYDLAYARDRLNIGAAHERIGLEVKFYLGMYNFYLRAISQRLVERFPADPLALLDAFGSLTKLTFFDMGLAIDTYIAAREQKLLDMNARLQELTAELQNANAALQRELQERKHAEEAVQTLNANLSQQSQQLAAANRELESFSYSVSHDLRAPLRHISGFVNLLQQEAGPALDEKSLHYLRVLAGSADHMGKLIDDLLDFSRVGRKDLSKTRFAMEALVQDALRELEPETRGRNVTWSVGSLPDVAADRALLRLVWINLLSNALKYSRTRAPAAIEIGSQPAGAEIVFWVRDNGVGFDMQYADKLFGVFQRLHSASEFEGTGIGLANVRRIVERHGGRVWAQGAIDAGATFYFSLPAPEEP